MARSIGLMAALFTLALAAQAQDKSVVEEIEKYRAALGDGNPAELWEARGEDIWKQARGPKNASFEKCDIGLGPGVVKGAYTVLPKYFADTDKVEDLESRLLFAVAPITGFTLMNADNDQPVPGHTILSNGELIDLAKVPTQNLSIRANVLECEAVVR